MADTIVLELDGALREVRGFHHAYNFRGHVVKHVLGFQYPDQSWNREGWDQFCSSLQSGRDSILNGLGMIGCPAMDNREDARMPGSAVDFEDICRQCEAGYPTRCDDTLGLLMQQYERLVMQALVCCAGLPRYIRFFGNNRRHRGKIGMNFLNDKCIFVGMWGQRNHPEILNVHTCFVIVPPQDVQLRVVGYLDYAKKICLEHKTSLENVRERELYNEETWAFIDPSNQGKSISDSVFETLAKFKENTDLE